MFCFLVNFLLSLFFSQWSIFTLNQLCIRNISLRECLPLFLCIWVDDTQCWCHNFFNFSTEFVVNLVTCRLFNLFFFVFDQIWWIFQKKLLLVYCVWWFVPTFKCVFPLWWMKSQYNAHDENRTGKGISSTPVSKITIFNSHNFRVRKYGEFSWFDYSLIQSVHWLMHEIWNEYTIKSRC